MKDPHYRREQQKYEHPIASRELIISCMERVGEPVSWKRLVSELHIDNRRDREAFKVRLRAMVRDGQLIVDRRNVYALATRIELFAGFVSAHSDGFGFLICDDTRDDIFLSYRQMRAVFHGDRVMVRIRGRDRRGREEGEIVEVLQRNTSELVGRVYYEQKIPFLESLNRRINHRILIENYDTPPTEGQIVVGAVLDSPTMHGLATVEIIETLGDYLTPGMEVEIALRNHDIPLHFSDDALSEVDVLPINVKAHHKRNRVDLRHLDLVTIDGEEARDFDDAVYCERRLNDSFRLLVAIADVGHYVVPDSALDLAAYERGTSVYFPQYVVPMLPEKLSNGLCSLRPDLDRLALVCDMTISGRGRISGYEFYEAVICSKERLTYTEVGGWIDAGEFPRHQDSLAALLELTALLGERRATRGALDFDTTEVGFAFDQDGRVNSILPLRRNFAHRVIEEAMLCANVCAARLIERSQVPGLYRIHERPESEKIDSLRDFLVGYGIDLGNGESADYQAAIGALQGKKNGHVLQVALLRSLQQAVYQAENRGHFGLAFNHYTHFTSPIRRYPDLLVHRLIKSLIHGETPIKGVRQIQRSSRNVHYQYDGEAVVQLGVHCSYTERRADNAVYEVLEWIKCDYLSDRSGDDFEGVISSVTKFGFFVELSDVYVEGLVHVSSLLGDYYHFDTKSQCLIGERRGDRFALGDIVTVQLASVDVDERKIDLELLTHTPLHRKNKPSRSVKRGKATDRKRESKRRKSRK